MESLAELERRRSTCLETIRFLSETVQKRELHKVHLPLGPRGVGFIPNGSLVHTNEVCAHIGDNYFVEVSVHHAVEMLSRRVVAIDNGILGMTQTSFPMSSSEEEHRPLKTVRFADAPQAPTRTEEPDSMEWILSEAVQGAEVIQRQAGIVSFYEEVDDLGNVIRVHGLGDAHAHGITEDNNDEPPMDNDDVRAQTRHDIHRQLQELELEEAQEQAALHKGKGDQQGGSQVDQTHFGAGLAKGFLQTRTTGDSTLAAAKPVANSVEQARTRPLSKFKQRMMSQKR
mmetsp:Transcript_8325/g.16961  ORF Transcript_8325/g.16961 Transcript_8325/m.16961 type:complete len:285 (-) Transcript_8325:1263-2117(-)|eukprot:CAMPEP_0184689214 /NCGR_PEP_ID=MMETSP0312-20130426/30531_1 /TAXON_ID=31354 /ORGANISM="Compsopogon coeruleus, Strain SAG 36.94" /LENGTH=284 /DNA_ID=CAMNT_0027146541 /DNA_START=84 /DNA_END=938 /DNA_ORIENTATION=+